LPKHYIEVQLFGVLIGQTGAVRDRYPSFYPEFEEEAFIEKELQFCTEQDTHARSSPEAALQSFEDAFHRACTAYRTRLNNVLRSPGINMIEKAVLKQRAANMTAAQSGYIEKQKKVLLV
jgi:hypothetical protein